MKQEEILSEIVSFAAANYVRTWALFDLIRELHPEIDAEKLNSLIDQRQKTLLVDLETSGWKDSVLFSLLSHHISDSDR